MLKRIDCMNDNQCVFYLCCQVDETETKVCVCQHYCSGLLIVTAVSRSCFRRDAQISQSFEWSNRGCLATAQRKKCCFPPMLENNLSSLKSYVLCPTAPAVSELNSKLPEVSNKLSICLKIFGWQFVSKVKFLSVYFLRGVSYVVIYNIYVGNVITLWIVWI